MPKAPARTLVLRPADPFDLIRWLARSQSDPRKAVAELVQNSVDARARQVTVERRRLRGGPALVVRDDGEGSTVVAVEPPLEEGGLGIPEPLLVDAPGHSWRSRFDGQRWEVNQMHEDYLALKGEARARLRYLVALLAKDLAQHAHQVPGAKEASEDVVAILALVERNLRGA